MKGGDFSWPPVGTFRGHQWGPQLATSEYFLMATDMARDRCHFALTGRVTSV